MPQLTLYYAPGASSMATHIALHETGAPFALQLIDLSRKENRSAEYLTVNPEGKVPTLIIDGSEKLTEVAATLWFLARLYPAAALLPQCGDIHGRGARHLVDVVHRLGDPTGAAAGTPRPA